MKKALFIFCFSVLFSGCAQRTVIQDADPRPEPIILTLKEEPPQPVSCKMKFEIRESEKVYRDIPLSHELQDAAEKACQEYSVPPNVLYAVMEVESGYQVDAQNGKCLGLMQIHTINLPYLTKEVGITDLYDPVQNITAGAYLLGGYLQKYSLTDSLMAYNLGEGGAKKQWSQGIHETDYTNKVLKVLKEGCEKGEFV